MRERWRGKSWATLGDSITAANGYQPPVTEALAFERVGNYGRSGCPMTAGSDRDEGATVYMAERLEEAYDCVTVFAGTNDYRLGMPLGDLCPAGQASFDIRAFCGAYQTVIEGLLARHPLCRLNLWTPLQRDKDGFDGERRNDQGALLADYAEAVVAIGKMYALPVLDLHARSGFNKLTLDALTTDRLHPNEAGHRRIADLAIPFLAAL
ncbi:SGNH/GDSL hydrolase family protein [Cohnella zeiphila]|uniref:SGNH/GDSL hydrolase family protein n=1 Tax=Cohnella zeiphila TaxID=2761120 RepID=A0A7X0SRF7_9BACL|nr:SGNH/GDSL hydrolase family protein [Cohnella zeiphila]MBB6734795.1 SGNH/GDSL hydrolase family protein [Cohnella zeiphila]